MTAEGLHLGAVATTADLGGEAPASTTANSSSGSGSGSGSGDVGGAWGGGGRQPPPLTTVDHHGASVGVGLHIACAVGVDAAWPRGGRHAVLSFRFLDRTVAELDAPRLPLRDQGASKRPLRPSSKNWGTWIDLL